MPAWNHEGRRPSFVTNTTLEEEFHQKIAEEFSVGMSLYASRFSVRYCNADKSQMGEYTCYRCNKPGQQRK